MAFLPDLRGVRLRLTARGVSSDEATSLFETIEERLDGVLAPYRYRAESGDLAEALGRALDAAGITVAVAESCTGGLIAKRITDQPGSSRYFRGGVVAYADEVKTRHLSVSGDLLLRHGAVSRAVASAMALSVAGLMGVQAGIGVTGVAGPGGGSEEKPVGTVCYAAALEGTVAVRKQRFLGNREAVRERAAQAAMALLLALVEGRAL
jgi:nicotinamide-nucleotide amidase